MLRFLLWLKLCRKLLVNVIKSKIMKIKLLITAIITLLMVSFKQSNDKPHFRFALVMPVEFEIDEALKPEVASFEKKMSDKDIAKINANEKYSAKEKEELLIEAKKFSLNEAVYAYSIQAFDHFMHKNDAHVTVDLVTAEEYKDIGIAGLTDKKHKYDYIMHYEQLKLEVKNGSPTLSSEIDVYCTYQKKNIMERDFTGNTNNPGGSFDCSETGEIGCSLMTFIQSTTEGVTTAVFEEDQSHK